MDRTVTIRIITKVMPEITGIHGACMKTGEDMFLIWLNGHEDDPKTAESFIHEMLHIYHRDHDRNVSVDYIEFLRHNETKKIFNKEMITKKQDHNE